jgi:hypothetical protein
LLLGFGMAREVGGSGIKATTITSESIAALAEIVA